MSAVPILLISSALMKSGTTFQRKSRVALARCDDSLSSMNTKSLLEKAMRQNWNEIDDQNVKKAILQ